MDERVPVSDRSRSERSRQVERVAALELVNPSSRFLHSSTVEAELARNEHISRDSSCALFAHELEHRALGTAYREPPYDVKDAQLGAIK